MAATVNDRDILIMGGTRTHPVTLPPDITVSGNVTGWLNGTPVQDVVDKANHADNTKEILENSGTTILMTSSNLFKTTTGVGGVFIGGGGLLGKNTGGTTTFSINGATGDATFNGTIEAGSIIATTATIDGVNAGTVKSNAVDGYTAFQDTIDFRVSGAPTNTPTIGAIATSAAAIGTVDIKLTWTYTQGAVKADQFIIYSEEGVTNPTTSSPILAVVDGDSRDLTISGVPMDKSYKAGIVAARKSAYGIQKTAIVTAWTRTGQTANITANIDGTSPSGVKNASVTLSSSGTLLGAGGGSITALDYGNVSGSKPPANATANFFTTSSSDPSGGSDGDAHWNSASSTMWFKTGGVWRVGGTINAGQITTGTLAAARIAASSITSDKLSVSTLSAITANLGTVSAGDISGSANINIVGTANFQGSTNYGGVNYCGVFNASEGVAGGVSGIAGSGGFGVRGSAGSAGNIGVSGTGGSSSGAEGVRATQGSGGGLALNVVGPMAISSTALVTNLNAHMLNGYNSSSFCSIIPCDTGTCTIAGQGFNLSTTMSGYQFRGTSNYVYLESSSDERLKRDIIDETYGLDFINKLRPVQYRLKATPKNKYHGFIAQEVEQLIDGIDDVLYQTHENGVKGIDYIALISPIVKAIQELNAIVKR